MIKPAGPRDRVRKGSDVHCLKGKAGASFQRAFNTKQRGLDLAAKTGKGGDLVNVDGTLFHSCLAWGRRE